MGLPRARCSASAPQRGDVSGPRWARRSKQAFTAAEACRHQSHCSRLRPFALDCIAASASSAQPSMPLPTKGTYSYLLRGRQLLVLDSWSWPWSCSRMYTACAWKLHVRCCTFAHLQRNARQSGPSVPIVAPADNSWPGSSTAGRQCSACPSSSTVLQHVFYVFEARTDPSDDPRLWKHPCPRVLCPEDNRLLGK